MSAIATENPVLRKSKTFQMRCDDEWFRRVEAAADRERISVASYIRSVVSRHLEETGFPEEPHEPTKPPKRKRD